jgi:hypothetical protein
MGAWGHKAMENDLALEWLANEVEAPLLATIKKTLQSYLGHTEKDVLKTIEAEAAAALLVDLTGDHAKMKYNHINCGYLAKGEKLWSLAAVVINKIMKDEDWICGWNDPQLKRQVLMQLLADLQRIQELNNEG